MKNVLLVSLHRCKSCGVRMFEHDCCGHLLRHGLECDDISGYFEPGPKDTPMLAAYYQPIKQPARTKKKAEKKRDKRKAAKRRDKRSR